MKKSKNKKVKKGKCKMCGSFQIRLSEVRSRMFDGDWITIEFTIECAVCKVGVVCENEKEAIKAWNKRGR